MAPIPILVIASPSRTVLILGAGLAGLTIAYHVHQQGYQVTLLDHPEWLDGFRTNASDAAPIALGCHRETRRILQALDTHVPSKSGRTIPLEFRLPDGRIVPYQSARLPGAFQWMMSLFSFDGLAWQDRWKLFSHVEQIWEQAQTLPADLENRTADEWLTTTGQSPAARAHIWHPLTQWLTGNALARLSAATFVQLLSTVFLSDAADARLTHLSGSVEDRFITPLKQLLLRDHIRRLPLTHRPNLRFGQQGISEVTLPDGASLQAQWYILALSYQQLLALLPERLLTRYAYFAQLTELNSLEEIAVRITSQTADQTPRLLLLADRPFYQFTSTTFRENETEYRLSAVGNSLLEWEQAQLIDAAQTELGLLFPGRSMEDRASVEIIRESHAALRLTPGTARLRPIQQSPLKNLLVAGAWTDTGWPANLESALISARRCADIVSSHPA